MIALFFILSGDCFECQVQWKRLLALGSLLALFAIDRLDYLLYGETPPRTAGIALIVARFALTLVVGSIIGWWDSMVTLALLALVPYVGYLYFGSRGGLIVGGVAWALGAGMITIASLDKLTKATVYKAGEIYTYNVVTDYWTSTYITNLTLLTIIMIFVVVSARVATLEQEHTSKIKRLLAQLEVSHARLAAHAERAISDTEDLNRTAQDIHDRLAQHLTAVSVQVDLALAYLRIEPAKAQEAARAAKQAVSKALQDVRGSVANLRARKETVAVDDLEAQDTGFADLARQDSAAVGTKSRWKWLAPRPFDIVSITLYVGVFVTSLVEMYTPKTPFLVLALGGLLLSMALLDRIDFAFFKGGQAWWVSALMLAARIGIIYAIMIGLGIWYGLLLILIIPYVCAVYFGERGGYIGAALLTIGLFLLSGTGLPGTLEALGQTLSSLFVTGFLLAVIGATASTVVRESAGRARVEGMLSELRRTYDDLAEYSRQALAEVEARNSLARDIHDGLGHYLTAMSVQLEKAIAFREIEPPAADQALQESKRLVAVALQEIRSTMGALRETEAESSPLRSLVELARRMDQEDLSVVLSIDGDENRYSRQALMTLYRAAQEGLTNVQKHAEARHVIMKMEFGEEIARLEIMDDGKGFATEPEDALPDRAGERGYGLQSMMERLELIGGSLRVVSKPGAGTELHISVPKKSSVQSGQLRIEGSVLSHAQARV